MVLSKHYIVQLEFEVWLAPWKGDPGRTVNIENAQRFSSRARAEMALAKVRELHEFPNAFVDVLRATVI